MSLSPRSASTSRPCSLDSRLADKGVKIVDAPLPLPHPPSLRHILDLEAQSIAYPLGEIVSARDARLATRR